jgi:RNA-splicing ligase RtcB
MNRPVVYGQHDDRTLRQMDRCMEVGSAAAGVLCADGHLGYGHPIGGVVGYTDHISISGVGFDIACGNLAQVTTVHPPLSATNTDLLPVLLREGQECDVALVAR